MALSLSSIMTVSVIEPARVNAILEAIVIVHLNCFLWIDFFNNVTAESTFHET